MPLARPFPSDDGGEQDGKRDAEHGAPRAGLRSPWAEQLGDGIRENMHGRLPPKKWIAPHRALRCEILFLRRLEERGFVLVQRSAALRQLGLDLGDALRQELDGRFHCAGFGLGHNVGQVFELCGIRAGAEERHLGAAGPTSS